VSSGAGPPPRPPQVSPDGKWVWNGTQWLPVARRDAVFPAWTVIEVEQAEPAPEVPKQELPPIPVIGDEPEPEPAPMAYVQDDSAAPAWERPQTGLNKYLYIAAGVVALVMAAIVLNSLGPIHLPWMPSDTVAPKVSPTPPITARSDYASADRLLNGFLGPAFTSLNQTMPVLNETCNGLLTFSCRDRMRDTDAQVKNVISLLDKQVAIACIAAPVAKLKLHVADMEAGLKLALQAYKDNKISELTQGLARYRGAAQAIGADRLAASNAQKLACSPQLTGP